MRRTVSHTVALLLAAAGLLLPASSVPRASAGSDWEVGFVFAGVGVEWDPATSGRYLALDASGAPRGETLVDRGASTTAGCAVDPATGALWTTSLFRSRVTVFDSFHSSRLGHAVIASFVLRPQVVQRGSLIGAVKSVGFDGSGHAYAGVVHGSNRLLKLSPSGAVLDAFPMPDGLSGVHWFDLAADGRTVFYTSADNVVRRYDLLARAPLADFAALVDGTVHALRLLPNGQGLLVAGSTGVTRLDMSGAFVTRYWMPARQFVGLNIAPDGRSFWTSTQAGELVRFDIASEKVLDAVATGYAQVNGLCVNFEYTAASDTCWTAGPAGAPVAIPCPLLETCGSGGDEDADGLVDGDDPDCGGPGVLHPQIPLPQAPARHPQR